MYRSIVSALLCVGLTAACGGGGSGVSRSKSLASLSDDEAKDLCEYLVDVEARTVDCGGGVTISIDPMTVAECVAGQQAISASCTATVGDAEDCRDDTEALSDAEVCNDETAIPKSCLAFLSCFLVVE